MSHFKFVNGSMTAVRQKCYELLENNSVCMFAFPALIYALGIWHLENTTILLIVAGFVAIRQYYYRKSSKRNKNLFSENALVGVILLATLLYNMAYRPVKVETQELFIQEYKQLVKINEGVYSLSKEVNIYYDYNSANDILRELYNLILMYQNTQDVVDYDKYKSLKPSILAINDKINQLKVPINAYLASPSDHFLAVLKLSKRLSYRYKLLTESDDVGRYYIKIDDNKHMFMDEYAKRIEPAENFVDKIYDVYDIEFNLENRIQPLLFIVMVVSFVLVNGISEHQRKKKFKVAFL